MKNVYQKISNLNDEVRINRSNSHKNIKDMTKNEKLLYLQEQNTKILKETAKSIRDRDAKPMAEEYKKTLDKMAEEKERQLDEEKQKAKEPQSFAEEIKRATDETIKKNKRLAKLEKKNKKLIDDLTK